MASTSTKASSSSSKLPHKHDVFLNFRGGDTRTNFVDHLYAGLVAHGFHTFRDDEQLERGGEISSQLVDAIKESHIFVVVFSENYADSRWCLNELLAIIESIASDDSRIVLPIFYHVDPSDVRHQTGSYATRYTSPDEDADEEKVEMIKKWRNALTLAANLTGYHVDPNIHESQVLEEIISYISSCINRVPLHVGTHLVGVDIRLDEIMNLMSIRSKDVLMVGICGLGGVGKSTMVKAIYNELSYQFKSKSFLDKVGDASKHYDGLLDLQKQLFCDISPRGKRKISTLAEGINVLKNILCHEKVLLVIDDVNNKEQLENLAGGHDWFDEGSRIFITSRDKRLLVAHKVDELYELSQLNWDEALELFSWHAFDQRLPYDDFYTLSNHFVRYCQGLPFALKTLGSFLFKMQPDEWKSELRKLDEEPNIDVLDVLKVSLDGLQDTHKAIFLDIACFFKGEYKDFIIKILDGCGFHAESGIRFLKNRCLLTISNGKVGMHNLIQQLGHKIVHDEGLRNKGMRSRLWHHMDVQDVLKKRTGTNSIEGIFLNLSKLNNINLTTQAMKGMTELRLLKIFLDSEVVSGEEDYKVCISSDFEFPSWDLCYLYWHGYPLNSLPSNFETQKLVELNMPYSNIREFGEGNMVQFSKLTAIILSHSKYLREVSNFSSTPNLEKLILEGCTSLREIDPSIGDLKRLGLLDLKECKSLGSLPDSICSLKSLKTLYLSGCSKLNCLPKDLGNMEHLTELYADRTATGVPPRAIRRLSELQILSLSGCTGRRAYLSSHSLLGLSLRELNLSDCYWWDADIPCDFWFLYSLEKLNLSGNDFTEVPTTIKYFPRLKVLVLGRCKRLREIPKLPRCLEELDAHECVSLQTDTRTSWASSSDVVEVVEATSRMMMMSLDKTILVRIQEMGSSLTMELPSDWYDPDNFLGFCVCFVFAFKDQLPQIHDDILCQLNNFSFFYPYWGKWSGEHSSNDPHMWLAYQPRSSVDICHPEAWSSIRASFELSGVIDALSIKCGCGVNGKVCRRRSWKGITPVLEGWIQDEKGSHTIGSNSGTAAPVKEGKKAGFQTLSGLVPLIRDTTTAPACQSRHLNTTATPDF
ncbi:disease resistance protein RPV1-like [Vitis riparia]|uniref:disease resistance protein RPV1-like n=1 Tax=Vitis riparia TaxID=96939 RepID=UPI00155AFF89|nr:disease resistance protein RPV1-like [Vitis riparia]